LKKRAYLAESAGDEAWETGEELYEEPDVVPLLPKFLKAEETLVGASRGTAYHRAMELLDFTPPAEISAIEEALERYRMDGWMTKEMADCVRAEELLTFLSSSCGERMKQAANAGLLYREQPFVLGVDAREIY